MDIWAFPFQVCVCVCVCMYWCVCIDDCCVCNMLLVSWTTMESSWGNNQESHRSRELNFPLFGQEQSPRSHCSRGKLCERLLGTHSPKRWRHKRPVCNDKQCPLFRGVKIGRYPGDAIDHLLLGKTGKDPAAGKDWGQEKRETEDETVGRHHRLDGREFERAPGVGDGQGGLACCGPWGHREADTTERWVQVRRQGQPPLRYLLPLH